MATYKLSCTRPRAPVVRRGDNHMWSLGCLRQGALALVCILTLVQCTNRDPHALPSFANHNVVLIIIDTLRRDHLGCYGYSRDTSPFIDSLANSGIVFDHAFSTSSYTLEAVTSMLTGRLSSESGEYGWFARPHSPRPTMVERFRDAGWHTGFFNLNPGLVYPEFARGFDEFEHIIGGHKLTSGLGPELTRRALAFANARQGKKFMLYLHYLDPHGPYQPPEDLYRRFGDTATNPLRVYKDVEANFASVVASGFGPGDPRFEDLVQRYDAEIAHTDESIRMLFDGLRRLKVLDRTLVVISADHGEEFLDHGFVEHAWTLYDECIHVPLIFWARDIPSQRIPSTVSLVDLAPTLLDLMGIPYEDGDFHGQSFFPSTHTGHEYRAPQHPTRAALLLQPRNVLWAIIDAPWKYIAAQKWQTLPEREATFRDRTKIGPRGVLAGEPVDPCLPYVREELFNLALDPDEINNVIETEPARGAHMRALLERHRGPCAPTHGSGEAKKAVPHEPVSPKVREALEALGYL
jgi:arylsulfatase A-like enzyme